MQMSQPREVDVEAPELGRTGDWAIGTCLLDLCLPDQPALTLAGVASGSAALRTRRIKLRIWYPAQPAGAEPAALYDHRLNLPGYPVLHVSTQGIARLDAPPVKDQSFPVVVLSHGFGGWSTQFSRLAEHIATRGYVAVSIDHFDQPVTNLPEFMLSFGNVLINRALDQRGVIVALTELAASGDARLPACADMTTIGLMGYSMGGYGALHTAGAHYSYANDPADKLPAQACALLDAAQSPTSIKALALFAPWGGQAQSRAWTVAGLSSVTVPTMIFSGSADDVVDHHGGVCWLFDNLVSADRHLLTYREARHNIVGDPFVLGPEVPFVAREFLSEPVWRSSRLNAISQHFLTAFLDLHLKRDASKTAYLGVPCEDANAGSWPVIPGDFNMGTLAGPEQPDYWRGFPRRWAAGIALQHASPQAPGQR